MTSSGNQQGDGDKVPRLTGLTRDKIVRALARLLRRKIEERDRIERLRDVDR